jgi:hypothetical protein
VAKTPNQPKGPPETDREHVTLPTFILHQLDTMVGPYAATRPEVIKWIVQTWLHDNRDKVAQTVREYRDFRTSTVSEGDKQ